MTDVRNSGPFGGGGESRPATVDLTRIDIRRGALYLPRRFFGALPEGEMQASDTASGKAITVRFRPPRQLEGLAPFFEEHDLRPNDAVTLAMTDELRLTPVRRDRRHQPQAGAGGSQESGPVERGQPDFSQSRVSSPGSSPPESSPYPPAASEDRGGWQDVLHDPKPRRKQTQEGGKVEEVGKQRQRTELGQEPAKPEPVESEQEQRRGFSGLESGEWRRGKPASLVRPEEDSRRDERSRQGESSRHEERPHREERSRLAERSRLDERSRPRERSRPIEPLPSVDPTQGGLFEERSATQQAGAGEQERPASRDESDSPQRALSRPAVPEQPAPLRRTPPAEPPEQNSPSQQPEEREAVPVGAGALNDVQARIASYLQDPATPAIVRAAAVAQTLGLPLEAVQRGMAEVSRDSDGAVAPIRPDVYLVKRGR